MSDFKLAKLVEYLKKYHYIWSVEKTYNGYVALINEDCYTLLSDALADTNKPINYLIDGNEIRFYKDEFLTPKEIIDGVYNGEFKNEI